MCCGSLLAARHYPGGFDWQYTVASALASHKHNPTGSIWFASSLILSMLGLWHYISLIKQGLSNSTVGITRFALGAMRIGLLSSIFLGVERLLILDLSNWFYKAHEGLALLAFFGMYFGILGLLTQVRWRRQYSLLPAFLIVSPLVAIGIVQIWLYIDQRDLGWVDVSWREKGIPVWLSFAFWQWLAIGFLWLGLALLSTSKPGSKDSTKQLG